MRCFVIGEPEFEASNWYRDILDGLLIEKKQKRLELTEISTPSELRGLLISEEDFVFVIGNDSSWLGNITSALSDVFHNRVIVLGNQGRPLLSGSYSIVTADISGNVKVLYEHLLSLGKSRVALYGINPASVSDREKRDAFTALAGSDSDLFFNNGSLEKCYDAFYPSMSDYDAVICVNSYAALSLVRRTGAEDIYVTSLNSCVLSSLAGASFDYVESDYRKFARAGMELARLLIKNDSVSSVTVHIKGDFHAGTRASIPEQSAKAPCNRGDTAVGDSQFYSDPEVREMMRIERMLASLNTDEMDIINDILRGEPYHVIADKMFVSEGTVKYKLKNLCELCEVDGRAELSRLLTKYIVK